MSRWRALISGFQILTMQFRLNLVLNLFFIAECTLVFLLANSVISGLLYDGYIGKYVGFQQDTTFFLAGAVKNNVEPGEPEAFYRLVEEIKAIKGVSGVGYQMDEEFLAGTNDDVIANAFVLSRDMLRIAYPLSQGEWFDGKDSSETQVILGGDIAALYQVGETVLLHKLEIVRGEVQYVPVTARVIGKLKNPAFAVNLHYNSNQPDYGNLFERHQNIILTDDPAVISKNDVRYPLLSLLIFAEPDADLLQLRQELLKFGQPFDFYEVDRFSQENLARKRKNQLPAAGMMIAGILFGVIGITYLGIYANMKLLSVYYICGMDRKGCAWLNAILNAGMMAAALLFSVLLSFVPAIQSDLFQRSLIGPYNVIFSLVFLGAAVGLSLAVSFRFLRKSPVATLRRFE